MGVVSASETVGALVACWMMVPNCLEWSVLAEESFQDDGMSSRLRGHEARCDARSGDLYVYIQVHDS
jgi:hypothetical protein